jgi:hypothetical protein
MKIIFKIFIVLLLYLLFSCVGNNNKASTTSEENITINNQKNEEKKENESIIEREYYRLNNDSEYDVYLKIEKNGVYIFDEMYNLEFIINGNNTVERMYGDLLFFINTNWYTWSLYNYKTKDYIETPGHLGLINYISENEVEITTGDDIIMMKFAHGEEIGKIIEFSYSGDTGTEEIDLFYHSIIENYNFEIRNNNEHKLKLFDKRVFIDTRDFVDVSYDKRHNIFIICVYSSAGR